MKKLRVNANYTGAFIVENFKPSFQDIYLEFTGMKSLWLKQCISQRKAKKDTKSWKKLAVMENISGILTLFVTTQQFAQFGRASKTRMQNYYHANFALVFSMHEVLVNIGRPASFEVYIYLSMEYFLL